MPTDESRRTYHEWGGEQFDHITAVVVAGPPSRFVSHVGGEVLVHADFAFTGTTPPAPQVMRIAQVAGVADGFGSMLTFTQPLVTPHAGRLPRFTVCDVDGNPIT